MSTDSHARHMRKVINFDHGGSKKVMCAWDECDRDGYENHKVVVHNGKPGYPQDVTHVFCSEKHRRFWITSMEHYGRLPDGWRTTIL